MSNKKCLTCKYEPEWSDWSSGEYRRCYGHCRFVPDVGKLPACSQLITKPITRFGDDSGIPVKCNAYEVKS